MAGLVPAIHVLPHCTAAKTWMPGTRPGMTDGGRRRSFLRQFALVVLVVELRVHAVLAAVALEGLGVFLGDEGVLHPVGNRAAALRNIHAGVVGVDLAGRAGLAAGRVGPEPGGETQRVLGGAEMLVKPARPARRRRHHADRLIVDPLDLALLRSEERRVGK